jgi:hypothetical protein
MKKYQLAFAAVFAVTCFLFYSAPIACATDIYPTTTVWQKDQKAGGTAQITGSNQRGHYSSNGAYVDDGNGSLELHVITPDNPTTDANESFNDWGFYVRNSNRDISSAWTDYLPNANQDNKVFSSLTNTSWGTLMSINDLSFDWYRETALDLENYPNPADPWNVQTPVLRLLIGDNTTGQINFSELVWEMYYTPSDYMVAGEVDMTIGNWVGQDLVNPDLSGQNFWRHNFYDDTYSYYGTGGKFFDKYNAIPYGTTLSDWNNYYGTNAYIYGLSVGVGSYWPGIYTGFVDNVKLTFNDGTGFYNNFELEPVPEPATLFLLGSGLGALVFGRRRHGRERTV